MFSSILKYVKLPTNVSAFEASYLNRMNRISTWFFAAHLPVFVGIAYYNETGPVSAAILTLAVFLGPVIATRSFHSPRGISVVMGVAAMFMGGLLVHFGQGPVQIEMHFYFFVLIALLAVFANPMVIVAAAATAALHHLVLWYFLPSSVFNYDAPLWVVAVHAAFVVLESVAACFIARSFFDNVIGLEKKVGERTQELQSRNRDMRMILNSVEQGFLTIDRSGKIQEERSAAVDTMFGTVDQGDTITDLVGRHDPKAADWLDFGLCEVFDGLLPTEVSIDQLPKQIHARGRTLSHPSLSRRIRRSGDSSDDGVHRHHRGS